MAVMEALRYPEDFDGIISGAPAKDQGALEIYFAWLILKNTGKDGKDIITSEDLDLIDNKVYKDCNKIDSLQDGLIAKPNAC